MIYAIRVLWILSLCLAHHQPATAEALMSEVSGKTIAVSDGDTIEILFNGQPMRIRLSGIDAPEKRQAHGNKAK